MDVGIVINKYYFPLATSRTILFKEIERIELIDFHNSARPTWGISGSYLNNWFHYDKQRETKDKFIAIHIVGRKIVPCLTPADIGQVFTILLKHYT
jgi:hypothetical protein